MNTHEYQAKKILRKYGISIPKFRIVSDIMEVEKAIEELGLEQAVVKVQVHAGGRGKAGGVKLAKNRQEILQHSQQLLGMKIVNNQTGKEGIVAHKIMISPLKNYRKEFYMGAVIDRHNARAVLMVSPEGGVEIEEVAVKTPDRVMQIPIRLDGRFRGYRLVEMAKFMGWEGETAKQGMQIAANLGKAFIDCDASLLEMNPLVETLEGELLALDAKLTIDDNALYRQKEIAEFYDATQIPPNEALAKEHDLAYVALDGDIGCMVNGAGLAMATMDMIFHHGGHPANFLDVGGGATQQKVAEGFKILLLDRRVKGILVNIFGGIMNCVTLSAGIVAAASEQELHVPLVVRMEGTNVEKGRQILADSGLDIMIANSLADAAEKIVAASQSG
ncbi:MAG: ADP-forming succinate--CoA ligase subunit beta [Waddliaceae bacterium]